jgi:hypothetical protein
MPLSQEQVFMMSTQDHDQDSSSALTVRQRGERGTTNAQRLEAPRPGMYWRTRKDIKGRNDHRRKTNSLEKGAVLLLSQIEVADGEPLVYVFAPHPGLPRGYQVESRFHADDFYDCFEPAPDGEEVRQRELLAHMREMEETKALMMAPPPDAVPAGLLAHDPVEQVGVPGQELATTDQVKAMIVHAERLKEDAERRANWITTHSEHLGEQGKILANFHKERATAALARANDQLEGVKSILRTVANLRLYTGEGVDVLLLRDGEPASPAEPITIYQDVLSFDEETLILLDQGGADHTHVEAIAEALADPALLVRMLPAERGMTLVRFRASSKEFSRERGSNDIATRMYNTEMSRESMRLRLLVRDGERLSLLDIPEVLEGIKQLMPSAGEQDGYFVEEPAWHERDKGPRRITRDDLDFAKRRRAQMGALDRYGQVLIALWGLYDRGEIFQDGGPMPRFSNWLDPGVQTQYLRLLSLDTLLGESRPSYAQWREEQNRYFAPGCTVAAQVGHFHNSKHLPAAYSNGEHAMQVYEIEGDPSNRDGLVGRVQTDATGLYLTVPMRYKGYNRDVRRTRIDAKLYLQFHGKKELSEGILVIDRVHAPDLTYYLQSRAQRRAYSEFVQLFQTARAAVDARDAREAPLRAVLLDALRAGRIAHEPEAVERQITDAIAVARTGRKAQDIPEKGTTAFKSFMDAALDALHAAATGDAAKIAAVEAWAEANDRKPLRLVLSGKRRHRLYLVPSETEHDRRMGDPVHASVADVAFEKDGSVTIGEPVREMLRARTSEMVIQDWNWEEDKGTSEWSKQAGATAWMAHTTSYRASYAAAIETLGMGAHQSARFEAGIDPDALAKQAMEYSRRASKGSVERMQLTFAIGSAIHQTNGNAPVVVFATSDAWHYAYLRGNDETKAAVRKMIDSRYRHPETHLAALDKLVEEKLWTPVAAALDRASKLRTQELANGEWFGWGFDQDSVKSGKDKRARLRITSITATGAKLFPWLLKVAERGLD